VTLRLARDDRLARLAASGDSRAFAVIYERYHQSIYRYCHSILHDPDDAADALQNAMIKAMRGLDGNERDIALKPWLFRIAHNEAISLVRRRRPVAELDEYEAPHGDSVDEDAATRERLGQLVADLRQLPDRQRGALLMRELAGLGFDEIAGIFGVSPAAAKQTVYEARTALHEYAEGRGMDCEDARRSLSANDRRMLRGRKLSAHLRDCPSCREFQELTRLRRRDVAALAPPLSASMSGAILHGIVGGGGGGGASGGGLAWLAGGGAKAFIGSEAAKSLLAAALVASSGAIAVVSAVESTGAGAQAPAATATADSSRAGATAQAPAAQTRPAQRTGSSTDHKSARTHRSRAASGGTMSQAAPTSPGGTTPRVSREGAASASAPAPAAQVAPVGTGGPQPPVELPEVPEALTAPVPPLPTAAAVVLPVLPAAPAAPQTP
jgi:RNA polymerase sigma factor (sigma-70 family)